MASNHCQLIAMWGPLYKKKKKVHGFTSVPSENTSVLQSHHHTTITLCATHNQWVTKSTAEAAGSQKKHITWKATSCSAYVELIWKSPVQPYIILLCITFFCSQLSTCCRIRNSPPVSRYMSASTNCSSTREVASGIRRLLQSATWQPNDTVYHHCDLRWLASVNLLISYLCLY